MKIHHDPDIDYLSIDFSDQVESRSEYQNGIIVRYGPKDTVIGIDITDSLQLFSDTGSLALPEACDFLGISESTMRRRIRRGKIPFTKAGRAYRFKKADLIQTMA